MSKEIGTSRYTEIQGDTRVKIYKCVNVNVTIKIPIQCLSVVGRHEATWCIHPCKAMITFQ